MPIRRTTRSRSRTSGRSIAIRSTKPSSSSPASRARSTARAGATSAAFSCAVSAAGRCRCRSTALGYLPADNRLDFNRFLTQDLAEIEVQKGYGSVLDGPGGMGGAVSLITRKPTEPFETELRAGAGNGVTDAYLRVGSLQDRFYVQGSASYLDRDHWDLSDDFVPAPMEDGGERNASDNRDSRANLKVGFMPNDTDEYSTGATSTPSSTTTGRRIRRCALSSPSRRRSRTRGRWPWKIPSRRRRSSISSRA